MAINNKPLGNSVNPVEANTGDVLPKLIDHNTSEQSFQEGMDDVARQVDRTQQDIGYNDDLTNRVAREGRTLHDRLETLEDLLGISNDTMGTQTGTRSSQIGGDLSTGAHIAGTLEVPTINASAVDTTQIANEAVTSAKIADGAILNEDINDSAAIARTKLETDLHTFTVTTGTDAAAMQDLGSDITVPLFSQDQDGVAVGPTSAQDTTAMVSSGTPSGDLWVLNSDNEWQQLANDTLEGSLIPAARVDFTTSGHATSADVASGETTRSANLEELQAFLLLGANRIENGVQYALQNGDIVSLTDTMPTPAQTTVFVYVGAALGAGVDLANTADNRSRFVRLGVADTYGVADTSLTLANNNFRLSDSIAGARTFTGAVMTNGGLSSTTLTTSGNTSLGPITSNLIPEGTSGQRTLGSDSARWDIFADNINTTSLNAPVRNANLADNDIDPSRLARGSATAGQVVTVNPDASDVVFMDPPIGVEMGTTLPIITDAAGILFSLTAQDGSNPIGIYRSITANPATWERLGIVNAIQTKQRFQSVGGQIVYTPNAPIRAAHYITIDGLVLVEGVDYNVAANRATFTLTAAVAAGKDIEVVNFNDISVIGQGELPTNALDIGNWTITVDGAGNLVFGNPGGANIRLGADGMITTNNDITAFG